MKNAQRFDYSSLAEILEQRGLVEPQRLRLALQTSQQGMNPFPEVLIADGLIGDWELSRVVCDLYGLPFTPVDIYKPDENAREGLDPAFLRHHRLIPLGRHGKLLTVCMPGIVPAEVLGELATASNLNVLPVVGTVQTNNVWIEQNMPAESDEGSGEDASQWSSFFDDADAAVLMELTDEDEEDPARQAG